MGRYTGAGRRDFGHRNGPGDADSGFTERFPPTSGRVIGVIAVGLAVAVLVYNLAGGRSGLDAPVTWGAAFAGVLSYAALLRPAVRAENGSLVLRNMLDTHVVPLARIREVAVRQVLAVRADEKRYVSPAIGNTFRGLVRPKERSDGERELSYPEYVRDRILDLADGARRHLGSAEPPPAVHLWAWPEIAGLLLTALGLVLTIVL